MANFSYICIVLISVCGYALSAEPEISVSSTVGSTVVLPCKLTSVDPEKLMIRWACFEELVFERNNVKTFQGKRYEGRVGVSVDDLRKGNCSLVLQNLRLSDAGIYTSYNEANHTSGSKYIAPEEVQIGSVKLSVSSEVMKSPHPLVLVLSLVSCLLVQIFCG